jgi:hypothetical protein
MQINARNINEIQNKPDGPTVIFIMLILILTYIMVLLKRI